MQVDDAGNFIFECPWCGVTIVVPKGQINCQKFVCGQFKSSGEQVHQHINEQEAKRIRDSNIAWGCINPFFFDGKVVKRRTYG